MNEMNERLVIMYGSYLRFFMNLLICAGSSPNEFRYDAVCSFGFNTLVDLENINVL